MKKTAVEDTLAECPLCHGINVAVNSVLREHFVACLNPDCMHYGPIHPSRDTAVKLWNKRRGRPMANGAAAEQQEAPDAGAE
jgi:hypothetical protein